MNLFFKFAKDMRQGGGGGTKTLWSVVLVPFFFHPFSSFSTQLPRLRWAFGLVSLGIIDEVESILILKILDSDNLLNVITTVTTCVVTYVAI